MTGNIDKRPLITVVVPVYNVEQVLHESIDSLIDQTYTNIEIILVDDGSTDSSGSIADDYARKDSRITVIHQTNSGLSEARNSGIRKACGRFITFLDSDDVLAKEYVEHLYDTMIETHADISVSGILPFDDSKGVASAYARKKRDTARNNGTIITFDSETALIDILYMNHMAVNAFGKLYKIELFDDICYPPGKLYEDIGTTVRLFNKAHCISFVEYQDCFYRIRKGSIQHSGFSVKQLDLIDNIEDFYPLIRKQYPKAIPAYKSKMVSAAFNIYMKTSEHSTEQRLWRNRLWTIIMTYRRAVIRDADARPLARIACLLSYLGPHVTRMVYLLTR
ncbi:glycosyltransferase family 2 protein [Bifidobacterium sp. MA2]|uniref:Glycosyltransferase family 2 protein n=2 Tax=Bifidobacterium santillanense TaxID=2809028 RepID=A0ABS5UQV8_9BIFI|nr:glycosyltransferase family 2 protein [Bifidobacterium santillanense]